MTTQGREIRSRDDIILILDAFYDKLFADDTVKHFFIEHMPIGREAHMPILYDFWETMLFGTGTYRGNPMQKHLELDKRAPLLAEHFDRWLLLWKETIDERFSGAKADEAKSRAEDIARLMRFKVEQQREQ